MKNEMFRVENINEMTVNKFKITKNNLNGDNADKSCF